MNNKRTFQQDYKNLKRLETPDLWSRIEKNLNQHPDRSPKSYHNPFASDLETKAKAAGNASRDNGISAPSPMAHTPIGPQKRNGNPLPPRKRSTHTVIPVRTIYKITAAAAVILLVTAAPWINTNLNLPSSPRSGSPEAPNTTAAETANQEQQADSVTGPKAVFSLPPSVCAVSYSQLSLTPYAPLAVPAYAQTVAEDDTYFSEDILKDTQLLCQGTVTAARLHTGQSGAPSVISYDIDLDQVYYSQEYVTNTTSITVTAPIIETRSASQTQGHVLYQLQPGASYLLPLKKQEQDWQLLCISAPQVQITGDGAYLFHSGYTTLCDARTRVVMGSQEGANDYYYDKMLLREDDDFLTDFLALTRR